MEATSHQVKKLKIKAQNPVVVKQGQALLQEAFNLTTFSHVPDNRVMLIRHLNLGRIQAESSGYAVSELLNEKVRTLSSNAVCVDYRDSEDAEAVWFSDKLLPLFGLLEKRLLNKPANTWYWKVIKKRYTLPDVEVQDLPVLINKIYQLQNHAQAYVALMSYLLEKNLLAKFFSDLNVSSAELMLQVSGLNVSEIRDRVITTNQYRSVPDQYGTEQLMVNHPSITSAMLFNDIPRLALQKQLAEKIQLWGRADSRSLFAVYYTSLLFNPSLSLSTNKLDYIVRTVDALNHPQQLIPQTGKSKSTLLPQTAELTPIRKNYREGKFADKNQARHACNESVEHNKVEDEKKHKQSALQYGEDERQDAESDFNELIENKEYVDPSSSDDNEYYADQLFGDTLFTSYAGFGYFLRLLDILQFDELLTNNPVLAEINFPVTVIRDAANRCGIAANSPLLSFLGDTVRCDEEWLQTFIAPENWLLLAKQSSPHYLLSDGQYQRLIDGKGLIIAQWQGQCPLRLQTYLSHNEIIRQQVPLLQLSLEQLSHNMLRAVYRYLRQVVGISLRSLVRRPGEIAMTRTHLDYIFGGSNVDMRVRSNGLDVNPGWVTWLARVVSFQYRFHEGSYDVR